jgi:hypothetical protein
MAQQEALEAAVLKALSDMLRPRVLDRALQEAMERSQPDQTRLRTERNQIENQLAEAKAAQQRLAVAISQGGSLEVLLEALKREEVKQQELTIELERLKAIGLKRLFDSPLSLGSVEEAGKVKFVVEGSGNFLNLLGVSDSQRTPPSNVVSPIGM